MDFSQFISTAWREHGKDCEGVAARLPEGLRLIRKAEEIPAFANLLVHVLGEHLGRWEDGLQLADLLASHETCGGDGMCRAATLRAKAIFSLCKGERAAAQTFAAMAHIGPFPEASTWIQILAVATAALTGQKQTTVAMRLFEEALRLASYGPQVGDPAARSLAITGNNLACELEEQSSRTAEERLLMLMAAKAGRTYWEIAGGWLEVERAEYRLAMTCLAAADAEEGLRHADACLEICKREKAPPFEMFFAHEARAKCLHSLARRDEARAARGDAQRVIDELRSNVEFLSSQMAALDQNLQA